MTPHEFSAERKASWRTLPDAELAGCTEDERATVRILESQAAQLEFQALTDIILNCHNKYQFAKTYKVLRADLRRMLAQPGNPNASEHTDRVMKAAFKLVGEQKLRAMASWFLVHFADSHDMRQMERGGMSPIDNYAGQEGAGCAGVLVFALCTVCSLALWFVV